MLKRRDQLPPYRLAGVLSIRFDRRPQAQNVQKWRVLAHKPLQSSMDLRSVHN